MPGLVSVPLTVPRSDVRVGAIARIGLSGSSAGSAPSKMMRSNSSGFVSGPYAAGVTPYSSVSGRYESAVSRYGSPSLTRRIVRSWAGGMIAQARSSSASGSGGGRRGLVGVGEPHLDDGCRMVGIVDVVDRDVGPDLRIERDRAGLAQVPVGVDLDPPLDPLEAEVRDRHERAVREVVGLGAHGERDDRLVVRLAADLEDPDRARRGRPHRAASRARHRWRRGSRRRRSGPRARTRAAARRRGRRHRTWA